MKKILLSFCLIIAGLSCINLLAWGKAIHKDSDNLPKNFPCNNAIQILTSAVKDLHDPDYDKTWNTNSCRIFGYFSSANQQRIANICFNGKTKKIICRQFNASQPNKILWSCRMTTNRDACESMNPQ